MAAKKHYADPAMYEAKLKKVMERLGITYFEYDWSRFACWVTFSYRGQQYRFEHSVENAKNHNIDLTYGSDAFAQLVLALEDLARMVERGIYDLSTWVSGMKCLPQEASVAPCFAALGFTKEPKTVEEVKTQYRRMAKVMHPDSGGDAEAFQALTESYQRCLLKMGGDAL